ncbi:MAG TPA: DinB family protein [Bryobacteraceae bacterium]|nr:DinB family protein [Bryobacteraceae bacterium]
MSQSHSQTEPWMRGPIEGVHPLVAPVFYCFEQVREDLAKYTGGLSREQVWHTFGRASVGFHIRHLGGSVERLSAYLAGRQLSEAQLEALKREWDADEDLSAILQKMNAQFAACEEQLRTLDPATLYDKRAVGRRALPTTVIGLIVHICEHTQRHLGQAITLAKLLHSGQ